MTCHFCYHFKPQPVIILVAGICWGPLDFHCWRRKISCIFQVFTVLPKAYISSTTRGKQESLWALQSLLGRGWKYFHISASPGVSYKTVRYIVSLSNLQAYLLHFNFNNTHKVMISPLNNLRTIGRGDKSRIVEANYQMLPLQCDSIPKCVCMGSLSGRDNQGLSATPSDAFCFFL